MPTVRHLFPGGNTHYGFYSFYDYLAYPQIDRKFILKGGPGVGKSTFMKKMGQSFEQEGFDIEYHWCSSDNNSLDGLVVGKHNFCFLDGTSPHTTDPRYPGAVDEIINLGEYWDRSRLNAERESIVKLTDDISRCFARAYLRLKEAKAAYDEWQSFYDEASNKSAVNRNITALSDDFLRASIPNNKNPRHLFPGAITPEGLVHRADSLIDKGFTLFAVKGSPGSGFKRLFAHLLNSIELAGVYAEVYHNPFNPDEIDLIILPETQLVLIDISANIFNYISDLPTNKYRRILDFDQFANKDILTNYSSLIDDAQQRFHNNLNGAVELIKMAKTKHDELEGIYIPAIDFDAVNALREKLFSELLEDFE